MHQFGLSRFKTIIIAFLFVFSHLVADEVVFVDHPPENFHPQMEVAGCFCKRDDRLLLLLRHPRKPQGNTWCLPGGKIQLNESPKHAVIREVREETGLCLASKSILPFDKVYIRFPNCDFVLHLFEVELEEQEVLSLNREESLDFRWVTISEALSMPLILGAEVYVKMFAKNEKLYAKS
jgi:8-oxo-dGTP diphosphatase